MGQCPQEGVPAGSALEIPAEFQAEAVRLVLTTDKSLIAFARDLGINEKTLGNWVRRERDRRVRDALPCAFGEHELEALKPLRKEVSELKVEQGVLRKAAAYFGDYRRSRRSLN